MNERLKSVLVDELELNLDGLHPEARVEDASMDSLAIVELSLLLSERHGVQISQALLASATTVGALNRLVEEHLEAGGRDECLLHHRWRDVAHHAACTGAFREGAPRPLRCRSAGSGGLRRSRGQGRRPRRPPWPTSAPPRSGAQR
ncbi:acyl carrier protein [Streptomyces ardesiacus]